MGKVKIYNDDDEKYLYLYIGREHSRVQGWKCGWGLVGDWEGDGV